MNTDTLSQTRLDSPSRRAKPSFILAFFAIIAWLLFGGVTSVEAGTYTYTNNGFISITSAGKAVPYPSTINVSGVIGLVSDVNVRVENLGHTWPDDIDMMLVSPAGDATILMSDACGSGDIEDFDYVFDDEAGASMLDSSTCFGITYRPTNFGAGDTWPDSGYTPTTASLARFDGENPNGAWRLFIYDDTVGEAGDIELGWSLVLTTTSVSILIPGTGTVGVANPYPLNIIKSGYSGLITDVDLRVNGVYHKYPDDIDMLLVSPSGTSTILMSDACGNEDATNRIWIFDDEAPAPMTDGTFTGCTPWYVRASDFETNSSLPAPAPAGPYHDRLSIFDGENPNGTWRLYIYDDMDGETGYLATGVTLTINTEADVNLITNGTFSSGLTGWTPYAVPATGIVHNSGAGGVFQFYRLPGASQAAIQQYTGASLPSNRAFDLALDLGNSSTVPKKVRVHVHDASWQDQQVCSFLLPAGTPLRRYKMVSRATMPWTNATVSIYASDADSAPWLRVDNVRLVARDDLTVAETLCLDPARPSMTSAADGANIVLNPSFSSGFTSWFTYGQINAIASGGIAYLNRLTGTPKGVLAQNIAYTPAANTTLEATFQLGNSSPARRSVSVLLYQSGFADTPICTFWIPPGTPLQYYRIVTHTMMYWSSTAVAFYPNDALPSGYLLVDNVNVHSAQSEKSIGTGCYEPGSTVPAAFSDMPPAALLEVTPNPPPGELPIIVTPQPFEAESGIVQEGAAGTEPGLSEASPSGAVEGQIGEGGS